MMYKKGDPKPSNWPAWLKAADIDWCDVSIDDEGHATWDDGVLRGGVWLDGDWRAGIWRWASVSWPENGECGSILRTLRHANGRIYHYCVGCFLGDDVELLEYIDTDDPALKSSRLLARRINLALLSGEEIFK